jgi:acetoacetate decarboxylase
MVASGKSGKPSKLFLLKHSTPATVPETDLVALLDYGHHIRATSKMLYEHGVMSEGESSKELLLHSTFFVLRRHKIVRNWVQLQTAQTLEGNHQSIYCMTEKCST